MIIAYFWLMRVLGLTERVLMLMTARLERKYTRLALSASANAERLSKKPGNAGLDALSMAKLHYEIGRQVDTRDRFESRYLSRQAMLDRVQNWIERIRQWKGRITPYLFGVTDVALLIMAIHFLGFPHGITKDKVESWAEQMIAQYRDNTVAKR